MMENLNELEKIPIEGIDKSSGLFMPTSVAEDHHKKNSFIKYSYFKKVQSNNFSNLKYGINEKKIENKRFSLKGFKKSYGKLEITSKIPIINISKSSSSKVIIFSKGLEGMTQQEKDEFYKAKNQVFKVNDDSFTSEMLINFGQMSRLSGYNSLKYESKPIILKEQPNLLSDKTLIVDLDDTLICEYPCEDRLDFITIDNNAVRCLHPPGLIPSMVNEIKFIIRPFAIQLLSALAKIYEIVIFTGSSRNRAELIMKNIDPSNQLYKHLLTREDCLFVESNLIKNIKRFIDRDPKKIIIIDNSIISFFNTLRNGIYINGFDGSKYDNYLKDLPEFLISIKDSKDVRENIYKKYHLEDYWNRYKEIYRIKTCL